MLKPIKQLTEPDERFRSLVQLDAATGGQRSMDVADLHGMMEPLELHPGVPADVRDQFDTARHAFVYSWFRYDLVTLAEAHAYGALENGLRLRAKAAKVVPERPGMKRLLKARHSTRMAPRGGIQSCGGHFADAAKSPPARPATSKSRWQLTDDEAFP
jgi:hypothetical protein